MLAGLLLAATIGYWCLGVPVEGCFGSRLERAFDALLYSFQAGTLGRVDFYERPLSLGARFLHVFESVLIPVQFGFFVFALRNRFRR